MAFESLPICGKCYGIRYPGRAPVTMKERDIETCCDCDKQTTEGIYVRLNTAEVKYPPRKED